MEKKVEYYVTKITTEYVKCYYCSGRGFDMVPMAQNKTQKVPCEYCKGTGFKDKPIEEKVPLVQALLDIQEQARKNELDGEEK